MPASELIHFRDSLKWPLSRMSTGYTEENDLIISSNAITFIVELSRKEIDLTFDLSQPSCKGIYEKKMSKAQLSDIL